MLRLNLRGLAISVAFIAGFFAVLAYFAIIVTSIDLNGTGSAEPSTGIELIEGGLLTSNRDHYVACVDGYSLADNIVFDAIDEFNSGVLAAADHPYWGPSHLGSPEVVAGCPEGPSLFEPGAIVSDISFGVFVEGSPVRRNQPSVYRTFFFITDQSIIDAVFENDIPIATQEILFVSQDQFAPVTLAIFVSPEEASNVDYIRQLTLVGAGVLPAVSIPRFDPSLSTDSPQ